MTPDSVVDIFQEALSVMALLAAPLLLSGLVIGLLIGMFQAATQINEMTLSFVPKLIVMSIAAIMAGPWMMRVIIGFMQRLFDNIPHLIG
jgi:flagellar biosynthesis protein FliQ